MATQQKRVGLVVLGSEGYMAQNVFSSLPQVKRRLELSGIQLLVLVLADIKYYSSDAGVAASARASAELNLGDLNQARFAKNADSALGEIKQQEIGQGLDAIVVYDCSPTGFHDDNFIRVLDSGISRLFYFGEKPIVIDPATLADIRRSASGIPFFCDFIETANPAVITTKKFVELNRLSIRSMRFWRASASGIKHIIGHTQGGVQGGAILDKAPHDLSIATMLLGPERIREWVVPKAPARTFHLIPRAAETEGFELLDRRNRFVSDSDVRFDVRSMEGGGRFTIPADGLSRFDVDWTLDDGQAVHSEYLASWIGYTGHRDDGEAHPEEQRFVEELSKLGIDRELWMLKETYEVPRSGRACTESQARISIIEAEDPKGRKCTIVSNYLIHLKEPGVKAFERWVRVFWDNDQSGMSIPVDNAQTYHDQKVLDLGGTFEAVIRDCCGGPKAQFLGSLPTMIVHDAMLRAGDFCTESAAEQHLSKSFDYRKTWDILKASIRPEL